MLTINKLAEYFISKGNEDFIPVSHLKLQKLCYYAQGWYWAFHDKPLFKGHFEAWAHGPVNTELYQRYRHFGWEPIRTKTSLSKDILEYESFLDEIWRVYGNYDAKQLEYFTHNETPWVEARNGLQSGEPSTRLINNETLKNYFKLRKSQPTR